MTVHGAPVPTLPTVPTCSNGGIGGQHDGPARPSRHTSTDYLETSELAAQDPLNLTPPPQQTPGWLSSVPPPRRPRTVRWTFAVFAVAMLALGGFWVEGFAPSPNPGAAPGHALTFSAAASVALSASLNVSGGPWTMWGGDGTVTPASVMENASAIANLSGIAATACIPALLASNPTVILSGSNPSPSSGVAEGWLILLVGTSSNMLEVGVFGGIAQPLAEIVDDSSCLGGPLLSLTPPSDYLDSPAAASEMMALGGSAFVGSHPEYLEEFRLFGNLSETYQGRSMTESAIWEVSLTTCDGAASPGTTLSGQSPATFTAYFDASSGAVDSAANSSEPCARSSPSGFE
jgi:hypothetical protein